MTELELRRMRAALKVYLFATSPEQSPFRRAWRQFFVVSDVLTALQRSHGN